MFSPLNKIHREVCRAKDLSAPRYMHSFIRGKKKNIVRDVITVILRNPNIYYIWLSPKHKASPLNPKLIHSSPLPTPCGTYPKLHVRYALSHWESQPGAYLEDLTD